MIDKNSSTWRHVKKILEQDIKNCQKAMQSPYCDFNTVNVLRGRIAGAEELLDEEIETQENE